MGFEAIRGGFTREAWPLRERLKAETLQVEVREKQAEQQHSAHHKGQQDRAVAAAVDPQQIEHPGGEQPQASEAAWEDVEVSVVELQCRAAAAELALQPLPPLSERHPRAPAGFG